MTSRDLENNIGIALTGGFLFGMAVGYLTALWAYFSIALSAGVL